MNKKANGALDPRAYQSILGSTFANHDHRPLISIGNRHWTRWQLGRMGCPHPAAAGRVARVIKTLKIKTAKEFIEAAPTFGNFKDLGVTSYWVVLALAHALGEDPDQIHGKDSPTFATLHRRALTQEDDSLIRKDRNEQGRTSRTRRIRRQAKAGIRRTATRFALRRVS